MSDPKPQIQETEKMKQDKFQKYYIYLGISLSNYRKEKIKKSKIPKNKLNKGHQRSV